MTKIEFDPSVISYRDLLAIFFSAHDPFRSSLSTQYRSVILTTGAQQAEIAGEFRSAVAAEGDTLIRTNVEPLGVFTSAENYHQKYNLKKHAVLEDEFFAIYPDHEDFLDSTAVSRANGYVSGYGFRDELEAEIASFGLSAEAQEYMLGLAGGRPPGCGTSSPHELSGDNFLPPIPLF